jgi:cell volume regulation protein A
MNPTTFFAFLGGLLVLAFVANRLYRLTRVPDVIVLMTAGLVLGPVLGWVDARQFESITRILGTLALILILFEGGLELNLRDTRRHFPGGVLLALVSYAASMVLVALVAWGCQGFPRLPALLVGAVLGCVSSSIMLPVLQQIPMREPLRVTLLIEASLGDVLGVSTVGVLLSLANRRGPVIGGFVAGMISKLLVCILIAVVAGIVWSRVLPVLSDQRFWQAFTFAVVLLLYAGTQATGRSGLLAALVFGVTLANIRRVQPGLLSSLLGNPGGGHLHHLEILSFHSELAFLVRSFFFILLGVVVKLSGLRGYALLTAGTAGALLVARWLSVQSVRWSWREIAPRERELALWLFPRGLITAVLAIEVIQARGNEFAFLPALAFAIILVTNVLLVIGSIRSQSGPPSEPNGVAGRRRQPTAV